MEWPEMVVTYFSEVEGLLVEDSDFAVDSEEDEGLSFLVSLLSLLSLLSLPSLADCFFPLPEPP